MGKKIDREKFVAHLNNKWKEGIKCPVCKENDWAVHDTLSELREFNQGTFVVGGPIIPLASITCNNCGYTMNFNAIKAGLIEDEKSAVEEDHDGGK